MRRYFTFLLTILAPIGLHAQISIGADDLPSIGIEKLVDTQGLPMIDLGDASDQSQAWDYSGVGGLISNIGFVEFIDPAGTISPKSFPGATMARQGPIGSLLGIDLENIVPLPIDIPEATAYYSTDEGGNVLLDGINLDLSIPGIVDLGPTDLIASDPFVFYATGSYGDTINTYTSFSLQATTDFGEVLLTLDFDRQIIADAFGTLTLPDYEFDVLRFNESTDLTITAATLLGPVPVPLFDTMMVVQTYKYFTNGEGYPVANLSANPSDTLGVSSLASIEYLAMPPALEAAFSFEQGTGEDCFFFQFTNESTGAVDSESWDLGDGNVVNLSNPNHIYDENGDYTVTLTVTDVFGNSQETSQEISIDCMEIPSSIELIDSPEVHFYPNPTTGPARLVVEGMESFTWQIFGLDGKKWHHGRHSSGDLELSLDFLPSGSFLLVVNSNFQTAGILFQKTDN